MKSIMHHQNKTQSAPIPERDHKISIPRDLPLAPNGLQPSIPGNNSLWLRLRRSISPTHSRFGISLLGHSQIGPCDTCLTKSSTTRVRRKHTLTTKFKYVHIYIYIYKHRLIFFGSASARKGSPWSLFEQMHGSYHITYSYQASSHFGMRVNMVNGGKQVPVVWWLKEISQREQKIWGR